MQRINRAIERYRTLQKQRALAWALSVTMTFGLLGGLLRFGAPREPMVPVLAIVNFILIVLVVALIVQFGLVASKMNRRANDPQLLLSPGEDQLPIPTTWSIFVLAWWD